MHRSTIQTPIHLESDMTTYKELLSTIKAELKADTAAWVALKHEERQSPACWTLINLRAKHMAYGLFRGRTPEQIEPNRRDKISWINDSIDRNAKALLASWKLEAAEDIAAFEARRAAKLELTHD